MCFSSKLGSRSGITSEIPIDLGKDAGSGFKLARIESLQELEDGTYWPRLQPYFLKPEYLHLRYKIQGRSTDKLAATETASVRGASKAGELDIAFIADRLAATLKIADSGLPDYCLTLVGKGGLVYTGGTRASLSIDEKRGVIYRGRPGTALAATGAHERLAIWIPQASLTQRLAALIGAPLSREAEFSPVIDWGAPRSQALLHLVRLLMTELQAPVSTILSSDAASRSFTDLLIYTLLNSLLHTYSGELERPRSGVGPGTLRRAESFIRAHVEDPLALHEVAAAAGCSVRTLQQAFRNFRETTPLLAIRRARLEAAREALKSGDPQATLTGIAHRFGFANLGRFSRLYKAAFGEAPRDILQSRRV